MSYKQVISSNLSTVGNVGWCLEYAKDSLAISDAQVAAWKNRHGITGIPNAWQGWSTAEHKHNDVVPSDAVVPLWFSYYATIDGVYDNYGHIVINVPGQGLYSSPWKQGTTHAVLSSIAEVERIYGVKYVGWSEDLMGVRVVEPQGEDMADSQQITDLNNRIDLQARQLADLSSRLDGALAELDAERKGYEAQIAELQKDGTILKPGKYIVK